MTRADRIRRMYAMLDGEATPDEVREIEAMVARDADARAELEEIRRLYATLASVPQAHPPEGLVASVLTALERRDQLSPDERVIGEIGIERRGWAPDRSVRRPPATGKAPYPGDHTMSKRKLWIGGGVLGAIVLLAISSQVIDFPKSGDSTVGTIQPAERYRGQQNPASDIKFANPGTPAAGGAGLTVQGAADVARDSAKDSAKDFAKDSAKDSAKDFAKDSAKDSAKDFAKDSAKDNAKDFARDAAKDAAKDQAKDFAKDSAKDSAKDFAKDSAKDSAKDYAKDSAKDNAKDFAKDSAKDSAKDFAKDVAKDSAKYNAK